MAAMPDPVTPNAAPDAASADTAENPPAQDGEQPARAHRGMVALVIGLGLVFLLLFGIVVATIAFRLSGGGQEQAVSPAPADDTAIVHVRPDGAELIAATWSDEGLLLHFRNASGDHLVLVNAETGREIRRYSLPR